MKLLNRLARFFKRHERIIERLVIQEVIKEVPAKCIECERNKSTAAWNDKVQSILKERRSSGYRRLVKKHLYERENRENFIGPYSGPDARELAKQALVTKCLNARDQLAYKSYVLDEALKRTESNEIPDKELSVLLDHFDFYAGRE